MTSRLISYMFFTVYILSNRERSVFFAGVTGVLDDCIFQHKVYRTKRNNSWRHCTRLVYYEYFEEVCDAIDRLDQLWRKLGYLQVDFIDRFNPGWEDFSADWYDRRELAFCKQWNTPLIPAIWQ